MEEDYESPRHNNFVDIPEVSDATVKSMLADLKAAGHIHSDDVWPEDPRDRTILRLQTMSYYWRVFGRPIWIRHAK